MIDNRWNRRQALIAVTAISLLAHCLPRIPAARAADPPVLDDYVNPQEIVSLSRDMPIAKALEILSGLSKLFEGKIIIDLEQRTEPIGVDVVNLPWRKALDLIVRANGLSYREMDDYFIVRAAETGSGEGAVESMIHADQREVRIRATFFDADRKKLRESGVNWSAILDAEGGPYVGGLRGADDVTDEIFDVASGQMERGDWTVSALLRAFESENLGEIIATPQVTVMSGKKGRVQVGTDFSIKTRDFAGNVIDNFFSTGTILTVTPTVLVDEGIEFIYLTIEAERSSAIPDALSTQINKTVTSTNVLMLSGEETVIAGLYNTEENKVRTGIPVLKDLPWWALGIRYLAGYDRVEFREKELVIALRVDLVESLEARATRSSGVDSESEITATRQAMRALNRRHRSAGPLAPH